jgi:hypothetical protein
MSSLVAQPPPSVVAPPQLNTGEFPVPQFAIDNNFARLDEGLQALNKRRPRGPDG